MTSNQLITLLVLYRGSPLQAIACGTTPGDLEHLQRLGWIVPLAPPSEDAWGTTTAGDRAVKDILAFGRGASPP